MSLNVAPAGPAPPPPLLRSAGQAGRALDKLVAAYAEPEVMVKGATPHRVNHTIPPYNIKYKAGV